MPGTQPGVNESGPITGADAQPVIARPMIDMIRVIAIRRIGDALVAK